MLIVALYFLGDMAGPGWLISWLMSYLQLDEYLSMFYWLFIILWVSGHPTISEISKDEEYLFYGGEGGIVILFVSDKVYFPLLSIKISFVCNVYYLPMCSCCTLLVINPISAKWIVYDKK